MKSTVAFNRIGLSVREGGRPSPGALDRAARMLEDLFGDDVLPLEESISAAVRRHIPDLLEKVGNLPDRLRLLGLAGEERARAVLSSAADLLKGDAGAATAVIGSADCEVPGEVKWATAVVAVLEAGAESDVRRAKSVLGSLAELERLFPGSADGLLDEEERAEAEDILSSERFHERLPDLRKIVGVALNQTEVRYASAFEQYAGQLKGGLERLEAERDWPRLSDEDRAELAARLGVPKDLPPTAEDSDAVSLLTTLKARQNSIAGLSAELKDEIKRRLPPEPPANGGEPAEEEESVPVRELVQPVVIATVEELDSWLESVRGRLAEILGKKKRVRIVDKS